MAPGAGTENPKASEPRRREQPGPRSLPAGMETEAAAAAAATAAVAGGAGCVAEEAMMAELVLTRSRPRTD